MEENRNGEWSALMRQDSNMPMAAFLLTAALLIAAFPGRSGAQTAYPVLELNAGIFLIEAEYAETTESRDKGLMDRQSLPVNHGMLLIFPEPHRHCIWMRNTHFPLSAAFIADDGTIINVAEMLPDTDDYHCADRPVHYVLEMNGGWFANKGIGPGSRIDGMEKAPPACSGAP